MLVPYGKVDMMRNCNSCSVELVSKYLPFIAARIHNKIRAVLLIKMIKGR